MLSGHNAYADPACVNGGEAVVLAGKVVRDGGTGAHCRTLYSPPPGTMGLGWLWAVPGGRAVGSMSPG